MISLGKAGGRERVLEHRPNAFLAFLVPSQEKAKAFSVRPDEAHLLARLYPPHNLIEGRDQSHLMAKCTEALLDCRLPCFTGDVFDRVAGS